MRWPILVLFSLSLTGCYSDQKQQLSACRLQAKQHVVRDEPLEIQDRESSEYIELCMQAQGYEIVQDDCPATLQTDSIPSPDIGSSYNSLSQDQKDKLNRETGRKILAIEAVQKLEPICYEPMGWFGKRSLRFEKWLGLPN
jgi:hypothetical protein